MGFDFLTDHKKAHAGIASIDLNYRIYYALIGLDFRYYWENWSIGAQVDCFPTFNQYLVIKGLSGAAWKMKERVGFAARLPVGVKITNWVWFEITPYYRFLPIGSSHVLGLPHRNLNQWGAFIAFRFFI
jgi:hypothetical protein